MPAQRDPRLAISRPISEWPFLEQLAFAVGYRPTTGILMLWFYGEDSRAPHGSGSVALGGAVATLENWCHLLPAWEAVIQETSMGWFHATEWHGYEADLKPYWQRLIQIMRDNAVTPIGCVALRKIVRGLPQVKAIVQSQRLTRWEKEWIAFHTDPLSFCLTWCVYDGLDALREQSEDKLALIFAKTAKLAGRWEKFSEVLRAIPRRPRMLSLLGPQTFNGEPRELIQLQVADLVAYELTAHRADAAPRWQYEALMAMRPLRVADRAHLAPLWKPR